MNLLELGIFLPGALQYEDTGGEVSDAADSIPPEIRCVNGPKVGHAGKDGKLVIEYDEVHPKPATTSRW